MFLGRQPILEFTERTVRQVWDPDSSLPRPPPTEAGGAQGVPQEGDQEGTQGIQILVIFFCFSLKTSED